MDFETFWGPWGISQQEKFAKSGFKASTINMIKKSLTFAPFKITLKIIFGRFPLHLGTPMPQIVFRYNKNLFIFDVFSI